MSPAAPAAADGEQKQELGPKRAGKWYSEFGARISWVGLLQASKSAEKELDRDDMLICQDPDLLRGVTTRRVLARFGRVFAEPNGDTDTFELSAPVQHIDTFLSHSWSTPGWLKYLALLYRTNGSLAVMVALLVHLVVHGGELLKLWHIPHMYSLRSYVVDGPRINEFYVRLHYLFALAAFWLTFLFGHYFSMTGCRSLFLDKVCIHQSDPWKKKVGIQLLGAFLRRSRSMLVLWQPEYFERAWCVFELAAFLHVNRASKTRADTNVRIDFMPLKLPLLAVGLNLFHTLVSSPGGAMFPLTVFSKWHMEWVATLAEPMQVLYMFAMSFVFSAIMYAVPAVFLWPFVRQHLTDRLRLAEQLRTFTFEHTRCMSLGDHSFVRSKVEQWFGSTTAFDTYVRELLTQKVTSTWARQGAIPYRFVLFGSLPHLLMTLTMVAEAFRCGDIRMAVQSLALLINIYAMADPIAVALVLRLDHATLDSLAAETVWARRLAGPAATAAIFALPSAIALTLTMLTVPLWVAALIVVLEAAMVAYLYRGDRERPASRPCPRTTGGDPVADGPDAEDPLPRPPFPEGDPPEVPACVDSGGNEVFN